MSQPQTDPFDTAGLRAAVLDAWRASPTRYREDANVEEDYALGAYRDRLFIELGQNAADAARAAGVRGRMLIRVADDGLIVANTGSALDAAGVQSMAAMRASAKSSDGAVGRFGVGFAAVLAVTDAPAIQSRDGGVRFSRDDSADLMRSEPSLATLLADRRPPVLRLPFAYNDTTVRGSVVHEYDTFVSLPWRDAAARTHVMEALNAIDDALFIALPDLVELVIEGGPSGVPDRWTASRTEDVLSLTIDDRLRQWQLYPTSGSWSSEDLAEAPTEVRRRGTWSLTWAVPISSEGTPDKLPAPDSVGQSLAPVVHAPTPTDEPLEFPALLVGDFPVDATRRRLAAGPMTDVMLDAAAASYVEVVRSFTSSSGADAVDLVPSPNLVGPIDGRIRATVRDRLGRTPWVPRASDHTLAAPAELVAVEPGEPQLVRVIASHVSDLVAAEWLPRVSTLRGLGLTTRTWPDVWDVVARLKLDAPTWHEIYDAAAGLDGASLESLPVLLADGRVVRDARRSVVPLSVVNADELQALGLPAVDPTAMHPLLERLGARPFDASEHLGQEFVARVDGAVRDDQAEARELVRAAATALASSGASPGQIAALGSVPVPTQSAEWMPAARVVMPGTSLAEFVGSELLLDGQLAAEHREGWLALGVLSGLTVVAADEIPLDADLWDRLMVDGGGWCEDVAEHMRAASASELFATSARIVRGLEHVENLDLPRALPLLNVQDVRSAIVEPALVLDAGGRTRSVPSPGAWWLSDAPLFDGHPATAVRLHGDQRLAPFFTEVDVPSGDVALLEAIGVHASLEKWVARADGASELLSAMARTDLLLPDELVPQLYRALADAEHDPEDVDVPSSLRARYEGMWQVVDAEQVLVASAPHHAAVLAAPFVPGDHELAELLDVETSDDTLCGADDVRAAGSPREVPEAVTALVGITRYREHESLTINGTDVDWWVSDDGEVHACTVLGLARGLAWASGQWTRRWEFEAKLSALDDPAREALDACYDR